MKNKKSMAIETLGWIILGIILLLILIGVIMYFRQGQITWLEKIKDILS